ALPAEHEETEPSFHHYAGPAQLPEFDEDGVNGRVIAGSVQGLHSAVHTHSPLFYLHWSMQAGARRSLDADHPERAVYVAQGRVDLDGHPLGLGQMLVLAPGRAVQLTALEPSVVMLLGGEPVGPRYIDWNFVSSSK